MRENFRIYVQISGPNSNFRTFQDKFQNFSNFRTTPRPAHAMTQCYLPHDTPAKQAGTLDLPTTEAQLILVDGYIKKWFTSLQKVTHPGTNWARRTATT